VFLLLFLGCKKEEVEEEIFQTTPYDLVIPRGFPTNINIPSDNPLTKEGVELGRYLFYDGRLSGRNHPDSQMSCGTCHIQKYSFELGPNNPQFPDGHPHGLTGIKTPHYVLPLINLIWNNRGYLWNGMISESNTNLGSVAYGVPALPEYHMRNIESLVWMGIYAPHEFNGNSEMTVKMISSIAMYKPMFKAAFGDEQVTYERISKAIAQFIRTIITSNSKFDQMLRGEVQLSTSERNGLILFTTEEGADCFHCHGQPANPTMTTHDFYNNAKDSVFTDPRDRYAVTKRKQDHGAYKSTTLRNIELTGPYMHDGRFKTLEEVVDFYNYGLVYSEYAHPLMHKLEPPYGNGASLNPQQKADLIAFLKTLTDHEFLTNPAFSNPFEQ
jgi:cytochrome c peroxidase